DHPGLRSQAAIDNDPDLAGRSLDEVLGRGQDRGTSPRIVGGLADSGADGSAVAVHCTGSSLRGVMPQLVELVEAGLNVVSTCEELSFPDTGDEAAALELDAR